MYSGVRVVLWGRAGAGYGRGRAGQGRVGLGFCVVECGMYGMHTCATAHAPRRRLARHVLDRNGMPRDEILRCGRRHVRRCLLQARNHSSVAHAHCNVRIFKWTASARNNGDVSRVSCCAAFDVSCCAAFDVSCCAAFHACHAAQRSDSLGHTRPQSPTGTNGTAARVSHYGAR